MREGEEGERRDEAGRVEGMRRRDVGSWKMRGERRQAEGGGLKMKWTMYGYSCEGLNFIIATYD